MKISKKRLLAEIRERDGNLSEIARAQGMTYSGLHKRIKVDPELEVALQEVRDSVVDIARAPLGLSVRDGKPWAVKFTLETWGKSRGFSKQVEVVEPSQGRQVVVYISDNGRMKQAYSR